MEKTFAEFFAGIGLMRMGLELGGWKILFANDIDEQKKEMYYGNFPDAGEHFLLGDIHKIPAREIPTVSLATASFPCNDLSLAGAREGLDGENSSAFWGFIKIIRNIKERRPPLLLIENVTGFLSSNEGRDFEDAMLALNDLGYAVDPIILDASRFVPQSRQRLFVVGMRQNTTAGEEIQEHFFQSSTRPEALADFIFSHPDINWRIRRLPEPPCENKTLEDILENLPTSSEEWWSNDRALYLLNQMSQKHRAIADRMITGRDWSFGTVFRRVRKNRSMAELRTDGIAGCLRTPRGGSGRQILFKAGKGQYHVRLLTPRECARLMGADDFKIEAVNNQALFGFGDAVCVPAVRWIAENYLNPVLEELYATENAKPQTAKIISYRKTVHA